MKRLGMTIMLCAALTTGVVAGCSNGTTASAAASSSETKSVLASSASDVTTSTASSSSSDSDLFSNRDFEQEADLTDAKTLNLTNGENVTITEEGVYVVSGSATDTTITVNADETAKVQIVLDGVTITNSSAPAIYVASADKVFVTTEDGTTNTLTTTGTFSAIGEENADGVIYSKDDIVVNGKGTLVIESSDNGIVGKDTVKVTGGTISITAASKGIEANDVVAIGGGTLSITAGEGIEGTLIQMEDGTVDIAATDDGINATTSSDKYDVAIVINGGKLTVNMGQGDTDALDSNGDLIVNGGTVDITAQFAFDFDGTGTLNGGTVTVNGEQVTEITNSMMNGGGGMGGQMGGRGGQGGIR